MERSTMCDSYPDCLGRLFQNTVAVDEVEGCPTDGEFTVGRWVGTDGEFTMNGCFSWYRNSIGRLLRKHLCMKILVS